MGRRKDLIQQPLRRPYPPAGLERFAPAPEVRAWVRAEILADTGAIHNPDHRHLDGADVEFLWAPGGFVKQQRVVIGQAELVAFRAGGWQKARQEEQFRVWFGGRIPKFLITLDASYCATCTDAEFCALTEHELYHLGQLPDLFGAPAFDKDGNPKIGIRGHDVEEFVGVVARYGAAPGGAIHRLAEAVRGTPTVSAASIASACGTCALRRAA